MDELTELSYIHLIRQLENENRLLREEIIQLRKYLNKWIKLVRKWGK